VILQRLCFDSSSYRRYARQHYGMTRLREILLRNWVMHLFLQWQDWQAGGQGGRGDLYTTLHLLHMSAAFIITSPTGVFRDRDQVPVLGLSLRIPGFCFFFES